MSVSTRMKMRKVIIHRSQILSSWGKMKQEGE